MQPSLALMIIVPERAELLLYAKTPYSTVQTKNHPPLPSTLFYS